MLDCIVVGAGPAGLFFASRFLSLTPGSRLAILDQGVTLARRSCPLVDAGECSQCKTCLAVYGGGGAGMYSDGKLSTYPAGSGLAKHLGVDRTISLNREVVETIARDHATRAKSTRAAEAHDSTLAVQAQSASVELKAYDVIHLGSEGIQDFCGAFEAELADKGVEFLWRRRVVSVARVAQGYEVRSEHPRHGTEVLRAKIVVFATGKASGLALREMLASLGVRSRFNAIDLGVRIEVPRSAVTPISTCHLDAKMKVQCPDDVEVRTFCMCDGGYLVSCYYEGFGNKRICTISGYSLREQKSETSNFGLLVRKTFPDHVDALAMQLSIVQAINLASGHGGTVVQRLEDFLANRPTTPEKLAVNGVQTTLASSSPFNLNWLLPGYVVGGIKATMSKLVAISSDLAGNDTLLHAPVWELVNDKPEIDAGFETNVPGVFVIGDATGIARGIVQSASIGLAAAERAAVVVKGSAAERQVS